MVGLRERKKARRKAAIQKHALQLFREQGYEATTVEQIAEAADVSPSTFFRYYPTKEDVVLEDPLDPDLIKAIQNQPAELNPIQAIRASIREVYSNLPAEEIAIETERQELILSTPELRGRMLDEFASTVPEIATLVAERVGRDPTDFTMLTFAGALLGTVFAAWFSSADNPKVDLLTLMDNALSQLESGFQL